MEAPFRFSTYLIDEIKLDLEAIQYDELEEFSMQLDREVDLNEEKMESRVTLKVRIGTNISDNFVSALEIRIRGLFSLEEGDVAQLKRFSEVNGAATLFPFLRSAVTDITKVSNRGTPIVLPLMNVFKMFQEECIEKESK